MRLDNSIVVVFGLALTTLLAVPAIAADPRPVPREGKVAPQRKSPASDTIMRASPLRWKTFPQTTGVNDPSKTRLKFKYCETRVTRLVTTGGYGEIIPSVVRTSRYVRHDDIGAFHGIDWAWNRITPNAGSVSIDPTPTIATPATQVAADAAFDLVLTRGFKPQLGEAFGGVGTKSAKGWVVVRMRDSQNQVLEDGIYFQFRLHPQLVQPSVRVEKLTVTKGSPTHKLTIQGVYNGCNGDAVPGRAIHALVTDPQGNRVHDRPGGQKYSALTKSVIAQPGHYSVVLRMQGDDVSKPYRFQIYP